MSYNHRDARLVKIGRKSYNHRKRTLSTTWSIPEKAAVTTAGLTSEKQRQEWPWQGLPWLGVGDNTKWHQKTNLPPPPGPQESDRKARGVKQTRGNLGVNATVMMTHSLLVLKTRVSWDHWVSSDSPRWSAGQTLCGGERRASSKYFPSPASACQSCGPAEHPPRSVCMWPNDLSHTLCH